MPLLTVGDARIHYDVTGRGPPLVIAAGQGTGPQARAALIDGLARDRTVLTYDPRGTGRSERVPQGQSIETLAEDIVALMDAVGFARADVFGMSTGTGKATVLAAHHPERVSSLVLAAPWTHGDAPLHVLQNLRKAAARTLPPDHYVHFNALLLYPPEYRRTHAARFERAARDALAAPQDAVGTAARLDAILAFDARPLYPRIGCPTLVMTARDDLVMPSWFAEQAALAIARARLVCFDSGGHLFAETRTEDVLREIRAFLA